MGGARRGRPRDRNKPNSGAHFTLMPAHNVAQAAPHPVTHNGTPDALRSDEAGAKGGRFPSFKNSQNQETSALCFAVYSDT